MQYAKDTSVSVEKSKAEIERILLRYGANGFFSAWQDNPPMALIGFQLTGRTMRIDMPMPDRTSTEFTETSTGKVRTYEAALKSWEQAQRQRWRALALIVKAKLEFVECGLSTVEKEFLADVLLPNGTRIGDVMQPQIALAYETGKMPSLLPGAIGGESD